MYSAPQARGRDHRRTFTWRIRQAFGIRTHYFRLLPKSKLYVSIIAPPLRVSPWFVKWTTRWSKEGKTNNGLSILQLPTRWTFKDCLLWNLSNLGPSLPVVLASARFLTKWPLLARLTYLREPRLEMLWSRESVLPKIFWGSLLGLWLWYYTSSGAYCFFITVYHEAGLTGESYLGAMTVSVYWLHRRIILNQITPKVCFSTASCKGKIDIRLWENAVLAPYQKPEASRIEVCSWHQNEQMHVILFPLSQGRRSTFLEIYCSKGVGSMARVVRTSLVWVGSIPYVFFPACYLPAGLCKYTYSFVISWGHRDQQAGLLCDVGLEHITNSLFFGGCGCPSFFLPTVIVSSQIHCSFCCPSHLGTVLNHGFT